MGIYVNNQLVYTVNGSQLDTSLTLNPGSYYTVVEEWDNCGGATVTPVSIQVIAGGGSGVQVTSPSNGGTFPSPVSYVASAQSTCASGIAAMGIYVNNQLTYTTYASSLNTSLSLSPGSYNTVVQEWDNCGGSTYTPVNFTVSSQTQSGVHVTSPTAGSTVSSPVAYVASASTACSSGVAAMGIYVNNQLTYTTYASSLNTSLSLSPGSYNTVVQEWDNCGGSTYTPVNITVSSQTPTGVHVTSPTAGSTVSSPVTYVASATTATCSSGVAAMGVYVNNNLVYVTYTSTLNTQIALNSGPQHTVVEEWDNCGGAAFTTVDLNVSGGSKSIASIAVSPNPATAPMGSTTQFKATAKYSDNSTGDITSTAQWTVANSAVASIDNSGLALANAAGSTTVTATLNGVSGSVPFTATVPANSAVNIPTWHADSSRTGLNAGEIALSSSNVSPSNFGKLFSYGVDGYVYGEPLVMSNVNINGATHNVVYVATENDSVYAFDSDSYGSGAPLWQVSLLNQGETPITTGVIKPIQGVTSTPVIDPATNTIYVVSAQTASNGASTFRLNALDITTGAQKFGGPVTINASVPGTNQESVNGVVTLTTSCTQRAALLLANNSIYMGFGNCHSGWLLAYNAQTLAQTGVFNASPNLNGEGHYGGAGGVWMSGGGPVADSAGNVYIATGNGPWDGNTSFADSVLKFSPTLQLEDYFTPADYQFMNCDDADLAAGGLMLIPGSSELVAGGKMGQLHVLNSGHLGGEQSGNAGAVQNLWFAGDISAPYPATCTDVSGDHTANISSYEIFGTSAFYNGSVYLGVEPTSSGIPSGVRRFTLSGGTLAPAEYTSPAIQMNMPGITPFISANGNSGGVVWMIDPGLPLQNAAKTTPTSAILRAYDAADLTKELYDSNMNSGDTPGYGIKFTSPVAANGKVYISTAHDLTTAANPRGEIDVYGLK